MANNDISVLLELLKATIQAAQERPLHLWEKALVLEGVHAGALDMPCLSLALLTGATHADCHAAWDELDRHTAIKNPTPEPTETVQ